ncbi:MAG TPA: hypothetical protein VFG78_11460 [Gemmatimonadota bacterium]|nr:hypothetical protein [Gemmatimonadota bacterium]
METLDTTRIDQLLETLTGVVRARVRSSGDGSRLTEIHILSDAALPPKQIVRNIETLLRTAFDLEIDHRIVSIAVLKAESPIARAARGEPEEVPAATVEVEAYPSPTSLRKPPPPRLIFQRLRVIQDEDLKCTAHVELKLGDVIFEGRHRDTDTPHSRMYSSARAVIEALEYLAEKEMAFYLAGLEHLQVFQRDVLVVLIEGRHQLHHARLVGTAEIGDDPHEAAVRAVLDAINRFINRPVRLGAAA